MAASTARVRSVDARSTPLPSIPAGLADPLIAIEFLLSSSAISHES
jgi:hypothetical protein